MLRIDREREQQMVDLIVSVAASKVSREHLRDDCVLEQHIMRTDAENHCQKNVSVLIGMFLWMAWGGKTVHTS